MTRCLKSGICISVPKRAANAPGSLAGPGFRVGTASPNAAAPIGPSPTVGACSPSGVRAFFGGTFYFFVIDFDKSEHGASLVSAIIAMGKSLNLRMVAEGVDNVDQFNFLRKQGIQVIQGYLFSKPMPGDEFSELMLAPPYMEQITEMIVD